VYSAFGLRLWADHPIPGLIPADLPGEADTRIWFHAGPPAQALEAREESWYCSSFLESGRPAVCVWKLAGGAYVRWRYSDGTEFVINRTGSDVWARWPESSTLEDTATYLLGPILGFVLRLRGVTCLHASAVAMGDHAVAFVGPACAGKSTTAAAFGRLGYPILSDDIVALSEVDEKPHVQPAYPQLRLWPESVALLYGSADALPPLTPNWNKRFLDLTDDGCPFERKLLPLAAVYVLGERSAGAETPAVERVGAPEALLALVANTYVNYLLDAEARAREFESLGNVVSTVRVRRAVPPAEPANLPWFCNRIVDDVQHR
jgi:hypothetical protein